MIQRVFSNTKWEAEVAYCRAIRKGNLVFVSGTTAVNENGEIVGDNMYGQCVFIFQKIEKALNECGASLNYVVRTRTFVTDMKDFDGFAKAHQQFFKNNPPVATCVEVSAFVNDKLLVEIEVDVVL